MSNLEMKRNHEESLSESKKLKRDYIVEPDIINYFSLPTLERIAIVNIATALCMQPDIRDAMLKHSLEFDPVGGRTSCIRGTLYDRSYKELQNRFFTKLSYVKLPNLLKVKVANIYTPVVLQMLQWMRHGRKDEEYFDSVSWTIYGTIDKIKTFKKLVNKESAQFHLNSLFELACRFCLEDSISTLWNKLSITLKNDYCKKIYRKYDNHLIAYWISVVQNELSGLLSKIKHYDDKGIYSCNSSIYKNMFTLAVRDGNYLAVRYFWNKLRNEEIVSNLAEWIKYSFDYWKDIGAIHKNIYDNLEVRFFLLSQMYDLTQQVEVFQEHSKEILLSLFGNWPWQRYLLPTIQTIWISLDQKVYLKLLSYIVEEIEENKTTHKLFRQLWHSSPINLKKSFIQYMMEFKTDVLCNLLTVDDIETIQLILNYANVEEKKHITFSIVKYTKLFKVIYTDKLSLFDMLLSETLSSVSDIQNLKEKITLKHGNDLCCEWICDDNFQMVEKFIKWAFPSQDEIDNFKNKDLDKNKVTYRILKSLNNYELVDKFMSWCFSTKLEVNEFKKNFAKSNLNIVTIGEEDWGAFEKFMRWCFISNEDIQDFKRIMLQSYEIHGIIFNQIAYGYNFEFIDKLIGWCCISNEQVKQLKTDFVFSCSWLDILQKFVGNYKVYDSDYNNWELTRKLLKLFLPLGEDITIQLKEIIRKEVNFNNLYWDYKQRSDQIGEEDLFRLIDNNDYNIEDKDISSDSDNNGTDDDEDKL